MSLFTPDRSCLKNRRIAVSWLELRKVRKLYIYIMFLNHKSYLIAQAHSQPRLSLCLPGSIATYALEAQGFDVSHFSGHSFRIGAATTAEEVGISDALIKHFGLWKSEAYSTYIRPPCHSLVQSRIQLGSQLATHPCTGRLRPGSLFFHFSTHNFQQL